MNSPERDWWIVRSGEYVLGTLRGRELERFERILEQDEEVQADVTGWEQRLQGLNETTRACAPPDRVWQAIGARLRHAESAQAQTVATAPTSTSASIAPEPVPVGAPKQRPSLIWPGIAAFATAASLLMATALSQRGFQQPAEAFSRDGVSIVLDSDARPLWYVETDFGGEQVRVTAVAPPPIGGQQDYQLWQVRADDTGVDAVGLLPEGRGLTRTFAVEALTVDLVAFAVSLEPEGGSPGPIPTGPVLYQGGMVHTRTDD